MKIVFWGKGMRSIACLRVITELRYDIVLTVGHPEEIGKVESFVWAAEKAGIEINCPPNPNVPEFEEKLRKYNADVFVLAGYGKILRSNIISLPRIMCINLHGGKLPYYRGSSPLNWVLINGENSFTLSIIKVDAGVDTGPIIIERTFPISDNSTIRDLHDIANRQFPEMLAETLMSIKTDSVRLKYQNLKSGGYYPLRFPDDGFILWDMYTAQQIHNRIRALTEPYPCATTYFKNLRVRLLSSGLSKYPYYGEPGRIYMKKKGKLLVCAKDKALWIKNALILDTEKPLAAVAQRYDKLATIRESIDRFYQGNQG